MNIMFQDENWQSFITMCIEKGCNTGCEAPLKNDVKSDAKVPEPADNTHTNGVSNISEPAEKCDFLQDKREQGCR